jgi:hypothetical protein
MFTAHTLARTLSPTVQPYEIFPMSQLGGSAPDNPAAATKSTW